MLVKSRFTNIERAAILKRAEHVFLLYLFPLKVYVALWNCNADDEDDLEFSRGNYLYIREKIPNSDWWVASLMDIPDVRVGLVPRNYIMPAYDL